MKVINVACISAYSSQFLAKNTEPVYSKVSSQTNNVVSEQNKTLSVSWIKIHRYSVKNPKPLHTNIGHPSKIWYEISVKNSIIEVQKNNDTFWKMILLASNLFSIPNFYSLSVHI